MKATIFDGHTVTEFTAAQAAARSAAAPFAWIDIRADDPQDSDARATLTALGMNEFMVNFALRRQIAGMLMAYHGELVCSTWMADPAADTPTEVHLAWTPRRLVTVRFSGDSAMSGIQLVAAGREENLFNRPTVVPGVVLKLMLASINRQLTAIDLRLTDLDGRIIEDAQPSQLVELRALRSSLTPFARRFPAYSDTLTETLVDPATMPGVDADGAAQLQSYATHVRDTVARLGDLGDTLRNCAQDYQTEIGNRQGNRIDQLTIVSIVFLPISFLTGYFGMNFQWLDNEIMSLATWLLLGVALPIVMVLWSIRTLARHGYGSARRNRRRRSKFDRATTHQPPGGPR
jgi:Mg2+ and Co2+ transporter CorA